MDHRRPGGILGAVSGSISEYREARKTRNRWSYGEHVGTIDVEVRFSPPSPVLSSTGMLEKITHTNASISLKLLDDLDA